MLQGVVLKALKIKNNMAKREPKIDTLEQIKRLLILALVHQGVQGKDIAGVIGLDPAVISRMVPARQIRKR